MYANLYIYIYKNIFFTIISKQVYEYTKKFINNLKHIYININSIDVINDIIVDIKIIILLCLNH